MMMCQHKYDHPGHRTYGDNIPGYAQVAYFPGDEPGDHCRLNEDACAGESSPECPNNVQTEWLCPICQIGETDVLLWKTSDGKYFCRECDCKWEEEAELAREYTFLLATMTRRQDYLIGKGEELQATLAQHEAVLENVRKAVVSAA
jgi:hypothetical protein